VTSERLFATRSSLPSFYHLSFISHLFPFISYLLSLEYVPKRFPRFETVPFLTKCKKTGEKHDFSRPE
jgi:hypothetical protein